MAKNKKITELIVVLFHLVFFFSTTVAGLSLGNQDSWLNLYQHFYNAVFDTNERVLVDIHNSGRADGYVDPDTRDALLRRYYSISVGSRLIVDDNVFLRVSDGTKTVEYNFSLFETTPSPSDNTSFVVHGNLEVAYSQQEMFDGRMSYYARLADNDAVYIPSSLSEIIEGDFGLAKEELVINDDVDNPLTYELVNSTNLEDVISIECKVRGIYDSNSTLGKIIDNFGSVAEKETSTAICSSKLMSLMPHSKSRLIIFMKYNSNFKKNSDIIKGFSSSVQHALSKSKVDLKCIYSSSPETTDEINSYIQNYQNSPVLSFHYLFLLFGLFSFLVLMVFTFLKGKFSSSTILHSLKWRYIFAGPSVAFLVSVAVLRLINLISKAPISLLTTKGLFFSVVLFALFLLFVYLSFRKNHISSLTPNKSPFANDLYYYFIEI